MGDRYWMASIGDGVRQYTINTPTWFKISQFGKRKSFNYTISSNHGNNIRNEMTGLTPEYEKMINYLWV